MKTFKTMQEFSAFRGELGVTDWIQIDQDKVDAFARVAGDDLWIHVDTERAKNELPGGRTIVHGFLLLSMVTRLGSTLWTIEALKSGVLYGLDKVRFTAPVPTGSRVRLRQLLEAAEFGEKGLRVTFQIRVELEDSERPAMVATTTSVLR